MTFKPLSRLYRRFRKSDSGNVAIITGLAIIPIVSVAGLAIDFQLVVTKKNTAQQTLDVSLIAAARARQEGASNSEVVSFANDYFSTLLGANDPALNCGTVNITFAEDSEEVDGNVRCIQPTTLSAIFGRDKFEFTVGSASTYGIGEVDVSFVFDLSGSMNRNGRLEGLKLAAQDAVDILLPENGENNDDVRIAIATYNHSVNVGEFFDEVVEFNRNRPNTMEISEAIGDIYDDRYRGIVQVDRSVNPNRNFWDFESIRCNSGGRNNCRSITDYASRFFFDETCVFNRRGTEAFTDAPPGDDDYMFPGHPIWNYNRNRDESHRTTSTNKTRAHDEILEIEGTIRDGYRNGSASRNARPTFNNASTNPTIERNDNLIYGVRQSGTISRTFGLTECRPNNPVLPLTNDRDDLEDYIGDMTADGGTAGHLGIAWGWYLQSPRWDSVWPRDSAPLDYNEEDTVKAMIIMTDGVFNAEHPDVLDAFPSDHNNSVEMAAAYCDSIKETTNITIFTIRFGIRKSDLPTFGGTDILTYCASGDSRALGAGNNQQLRDQFRNIAVEITDLRLSQ